MISTVLICKDCSFYAGIILGTMQGITILAHYFFVNTEPANKTLLKQVIIATLIEQSYYFEMHVVRKVGLSSDLDNNTLMKLWSMNGVFSHLKEELAWAIYKWFQVISTIMLFK